MFDSLIMGQAANVGMAPPDMNESFLPRILSIFYATFDQIQGPKIMYQVPEDSISVAPPPPLTASSASAALRSPSLTYTPSSFTSSSSSRWAATLDEPEPLTLNHSLHSSPAGSQVNLASPGMRADKTANSSPFMYPNSITGGGISRSRPMGGTPAGRPPLLDFESISEYVIPKTELCGRLVHCNTPKHRILGFPVVLEGKRYERNAFRYNLCFVFDRKADLSCYEPVVRKCARVLLSCEEESQFLSNPDTSGKMYQILEQLFEDLNSYSETSIRIDSFNSIELKIFPFYPNPPKVRDWQVPVALINLQKRMDPSWDLTVAKICPYINGVNHVRKIADLADVDPLLARMAMEHLL
ncbi:Nitrogen permease regulator 2 [Tulasnella sp. 419]|nr:Nitrogen permease regulator 2 [Tulasnella sp. 419]